MRLRPITDKVPKPMVLVNGKPFLQHLLKQLEENGIRRIVLMTGYLGEQIRDYFGNGSAFGLDIEYSHGHVDWSTGRRLYEANDLFDDDFLLLYADNFVPFNLKVMSNFFRNKASKKVVSFIVQPKAAGNIKLLADGTVAIYDKTRSARGLNFVEVGYMIIDKNALFGYYNDIADDFSDILTRLVAEHQVAGMAVLDQYHSISDPKRLQLTAQYLEQKKILILDRDGIINRKAPKGEYITKWSDFHLITESINSLKQLAKAGFKFVVISNQAGIGRGMVSAAMVQDINQRMVNELHRNNIIVLQVYICPHHFEDNCCCRKPNPGMFFNASRDWLFRLDKTFFIGDDPRDCKAAYNAGSNSIFVGASSALSGLSNDELPQQTVADLSQVLFFLENHDYFKNTI